MRRTMPLVSGRMLQNLLYLAQCYALHRLDQLLFPNEMGAVSDGIEISRDVLTSESALSFVQLDVLDEVLQVFGKCSDDEVADVVRATCVWQEANSGGWYLAPEVIRDESACDLPVPEHS